MDNSSEPEGLGDSKPGYTTYMAQPSIEARSNIFDRDRISHLMSSG